MTTEKLQDMISRRKIVFSNLRGTHPFWEGNKNKILNMMISLGRPPDAFCTLSSADCYWKGLEDYLLRYVGLSLQIVVNDSFKDEQESQRIRGLCEHSLKDRMILLNENQVLASRFFVMKLKVFFKEIMKCKVRIVLLEFYSIDCSGYIRC